MSTSRARRARRSGVPYREPVVATACRVPARPATAAALQGLARGAAQLVAVPNDPGPGPVRENARFSGHRHSDEARAKMRAAWARRKEGRG